jgi:hypothetical protein
MNLTAFSGPRWSAQHNQGPHATIASATFLSSYGSGGGSALDVLTAQNLHHPILVKQTSRVVELQMLTMAFYFTIASCTVTINPKVK